MTDREREAQAAAMKEAAAKITGTPAADLFTEDAGADFDTLPEPAQSRSTGRRI
jgi:hypothetical protein